MKNARKDGVKNIWKEVTYDHSYQRKAKIYLPNEWKQINAPIIKLKKWKKKKTEDEKDNRVEKIFKDEAFFVYSGLVLVSSGIFLVASGHFIFF